MSSPNQSSSPDEIEALSFQIIDQEVVNKPLNQKAWEIARRLIHTSGDITLLNDLYLSDSAIEAGLKAIRNGAKLFTDTKMVKAGIPMRRLVPFGCMVNCFTSPPEVAVHAAYEKSTRARAGMLCIQAEIHNNIIVIGNAPTALLTLLELFETQAIGKPALVVGMPVGFVNAAESKELLYRQKEIPSILIRGRKGGSSLAAATINALAIIAAKHNPDSQA